MAMLLAPSTIQAQNFDDYFVDKTLRVDYTFAGNKQTQMIAVDQLNVMPRWYGKHQRLAELPVEGNGQITVRDHRTGKVIYRNSFSTLFQEWLSYPESEKNTQSFENVFLVPMPKDTVDITVDLRNNRREVMTSLTHQWLQRTFSSIRWATSLLLTKPCSRLPIPPSVSTSPTWLKAIPRQKCLSS